MAVLELFIKLVLYPYHFYLTLNNLLRAVIYTS